MNLPAPGIVVDRAALVAEETREKAGDESTVNVLPTWLQTEDPPGQTTREDGSYVGPTAGDLGRLHATVSAVSQSENACLHFPDADHTAVGPWLVVEPLGGRLSTVHRGEGSVTITCEEIAGGVDTSLRKVSDLVQRLLEAARPRHKWYPVDRDEDGVFTTGLTTFSFVEVSLDADRPRLEFDVATTPTSRPNAVEARFEAVAGVSDATFEPGVPVAQSRPDAALVRTAEAVTERVMGDWAYEWGPEPTPFSHIPTQNKLALGTGMPAAKQCDEATIEDCQRLLDGILTEQEGAT